jgi:hypothetical protein
MKIVTKIVTNDGYEWQMYSQEYIYELQLQNEYPVHILHYKQLPLTAAELKINKQLIPIPNDPAFRRLKHARKAGNLFENIL